jgi:predicted RNA-binding Zn ribbon-like protein
MSFPWPASARFGLATAPGGAALVQDFLNTKAIADYPDLLTEPATAQAWASAAVDAWSEVRHLEPPTLALSGADCAKLRTLRATIAGLLAGDATAAAGSTSASASYSLSAAGEVGLQPIGTGWRWLASALWGEILLSQQADVWRRFKLCRNPVCRSTFYDRSKNNSGVWHDVKVCGNAANLRSSRARRAAAASGDVL